MKRAKKEAGRLVLEGLEPRWLLSGFWQGVDVDGDLVSVELVGRGELVVESQAEGLGERVDLVGVYGTARSSRLWVWTDMAAGGDGLVEIGAVDAVGEVLREIVAQARIGDMGVGWVKVIEAYEAGTIHGERAAWEIGGPMNELYVAGHVEEVDISVVGNVGRVTVEGDVAGATLAVDGHLRRLNVWGDVVDSEVSGWNVGRVILEGHMVNSAVVAEGRLGYAEVWGDMAEDSYLGAVGRVGRVLVGGAMDFSLVESLDRVQMVYVAGDMVDSTVYGEWGIGKVIVDGSITGSVIETGNRIGVVDAWEWIEETDIIAPGGVRAIYAYNISDVNLETPWVGRQWLDAYARTVWYDHLYVEVDTGWYWPVYDVEYVDVVYYGSYEIYYYEPVYWDVYYDGGYYYEEWYYDPYYYDAGGYYDYYYYDYYY